MKLTSLLAATGAVCLLSGVAHAAEPSFDVKYTFNWLKSPGKQRCIKIDAKLASLISSSAFRCHQNEGNTEVGETVPACKAARGDIEYLIFNTRASCENERQAQDANSEEE
jgi:hypothetical protein